MYRAAPVIVSDVHAREISGQASPVTRVTWTVSPAVPVVITAPQNYTFTVQYTCLSSDGQWMVPWINGSSVANYNTASADIGGLVRNAACAVRVLPFRQQFDEILQDTPAGVNITLSEIIRSVWSRSIYY